MTFAIAVGSSGKNPRRKRRKTRKRRTMTRKVRTTVKSVMMCSLVEPLGGGIIGSRLEELSNLLFNVYTGSFLKQQKKPIINENRSLRHRTAVLQSPMLVQF
ncbi:unnamed protein product [Nesidiocoris tenuis]|uniref:Uncharacterized protein n=1 Tax=Nesidiocoris tenuis TaxID=355587 RepID=A0A6H5GKY8_9HEMI|nr:unnamed protein product [Nesidiocoris tenuis]